MPGKQRREAYGEGTGAAKAAGDRKNDPDD